MNLRVETFTQPSQLSHLVPEWEALWREQPYPLPFTTPEWNLCWWEHLSERTRGVRDNLRTVGVRDPGGKLLAVAPLMLTERPGTGPARFRQLQFFGADPYITEMRAPLLAQGREQEALLALTGHLRHVDRGWDWLTLCGLTEEQARWVETRDRARPSRTVPMYLLDLAPSWDELRARLKPNIKESLRKCYNSLKRDNLAFEFEVAQDAQAISGGLDAFFRLHSSRAQLSDTVTHRDVFTSARAQRFLRAYCARTAGRGTVVFLLRIKGEVVACRIGFVLKDTLYLYFSGYDPAWSKYSVMTTAVAEAFKWSIQQGLKTVNLSFGTDVSKTRWGPREILLKDEVLVAEGWRGSLAYDGYAFLSRVKESKTVRRFAQGLLRGAE